MNMAMRSALCAFVGCVAMVTAAGCSAETAEDTTVQVTAQDDAVDDKGLYMIGYSSTDDDGVNSTAADCPGATTATHRQATKLFQYAIGNDTAVTFPTTTACTDVKNALLNLRSAIFSNKVTVKPYSTSAVPVCGQPSSVYDIADAVGVSGGPLWQIVGTLYSQTDACFGAGVRKFLVFDQWGGIGTFAAKLDPEPATLTANLGATSGATAAAYYTDSLVGTTVHKFGTSYTSCGGRLGGEPCSPTALAAGEVVTKAIFKSGTLCACR
jgi:hypothetical protein